uniref:Uncharacterized protein n=1 Tax=Avena sativa TaxID=4498 RepID=A0ACD5YAB3_AVESA
MAASNTGIHLFLVLSYVSYLASHAAALSFNYSGSDYPALVSRHDAPLAINATAGTSNVVAAGWCYCQAWPQRSGAGPEHVLFNLGEVDSPTSFEKTYYVSVGPSSALLSLKQLVKCSTDLAFLTVHAFQEKSFELGLSCSAGSLGVVQFRSLPGYTSTRGIGRVPRNYTALYSHEPRDQPTTTRKLLSSTSTYDRNTRADPRQMASSWMEKLFVAGSAFVGLICAVLCCIRSKRRPWQRTAAVELEDEIIREHDLRQGLGPRRIRFSELAAATDNFAEERRIGRGGFGPVYRGYLSVEDRHVAIKAPEHRPARRLVRSPGGLALVYELMPGGSLDPHLYNHDRHLTWPQRYNIALQLGSALRYLHTECDQCVVHGDIKPANVMLDASGNAKLGDFGLARLVDHGAEPRTTQVVAGTVGYIDPEFVRSRRPSAESDVYSFGVVLLEIACGRRPTPSRRPDQAASATLLASVRDMYRRNVILEATDGRLDGEFDRMQMERLLVTGLWCAQHDPVQRPSIAQAVDVLRSKDAELPVVQTMDGSDEEIRALEGQAYGDMCAQSSVYLDASTETEYLTTED